MFRLILLIRDSFLCIKITEVEKQVSFHSKRKHERKGTKMEFKEWLQEFTVYLKEYGSSPDEIKQIVADRDDDIKFAFSKQADSEIAAIRIGKSYFKTKMEAEAKEVFEKYSSQHPKIYCVGHCLDHYFSWLEAQWALIDHFKSEPTKNHNDSCKKHGELKFYDDDLEYIPKNGQAGTFSKVVRILSNHLGVNGQKILVISILRSKYSVLQELISLKSMIPLHILRAGIPCEVPQDLFDTLSDAINEITNTQLFLLDLAEPVETDEFIKLLGMAQKKGEFSTILIAGLMYLFSEPDQKLIKGTVNKLKEFAEVYEVKILV